jgi:hypothetical protein
VSEHYRQFSRAEWTRNVLEAIDAHRDEATCDLVADVLAQVRAPCPAGSPAQSVGAVLQWSWGAPLVQSEPSCIGADVSAARAPEGTRCAPLLHFVAADAPAAPAPQRVGAQPLLLHSVLPARVARGIQAAAARLRPESPPEEAALSAVELADNLRAVLPGRSAVEAQELAGLLASSEGAGGKATFVAAHFLSGDMTHEELKLLSLLRQQATEAARVDAAELRDALLEAAGRHRSKQGLKKVNVLDMRAAFLKVPRPPRGALCPAARASLCRSMPVPQHACAAALPRRSARHGKP